MKLVKFQLPYNYRHKLPLHILEELERRSNGRGDKLARCFFDHKSCIWFWCNAPCFSLSHADRNIRSCPAPQELQEYFGFFFFKPTFGVEALWLLSPLGSGQPPLLSAGYIYSGLMVFIHAGLPQTQQHCLHGHKTDINTPHPNPQPCLVLLCLPSCRQNQRVSLCLHFCFVDWNMEMYFFYGASKGGNKNSWEEGTVGSKDIF